jgi:hypothetical protein
MKIKINLIAILGIFALVSCGTPSGAESETGSKTLTPESTEGLADVKSYKNSEDETGKIDNNVKHLSGSYKGATEKGLEIELNFITLESGVCKASVIGLSDQKIILEGKYLKNDERADGPDYGEGFNISLNGAENVSLKLEVDFYTDESDSQGDSREYGLGLDIKNPTVNAYFKNGSTQKNFTLKKAL